ncbi:MAG TPA: YfhO family protein, partial [Chloroflexota bacterium]|nr:YfhO family protein [Chloroflexota bacterium]
MKTELVGRREAGATPDSGPRSWLVDTRDLGAGAVLFLTILAFFWPMIRPWPPRWYIVAGDFSEQFFPFRAFEAKEWWAKRIPLWNPDMFAGHPFQADIQTAVFYPIAAANAILFGRHGFPFAALEGEIVFHTLLAGIFTYMLARVLISSRLGSLLAAVTFALSGFITSYPAQQLPLLESAIWLPLIVLFLELSARRKGDWRWLMAASIAFALALLAGHTQTGLFIVYSTEGYLLWRCWQQRVSWQRTLLCVVAYPATSILLSAIQILPTLAFLPVSTRDHLTYLV